MRGLLILLLFLATGCQQTAQVHERELEGKPSVATLVAGPFQLNQRYRSMEGPYIIQNARVGDLIQAGTTVLPESKIRSARASMQGDFHSLTALGPARGPRKLYWLKAIDLVVLDENEKVLPTAEFICHMNLDVDMNARNQAFPQAERCVNPRLITLTQGQTHLEFPAGFALPVASDETWIFTLQAANRTTDEHRRIKHRCQLTFIEDSQLRRPIKPLAWIPTFVSVVVDRNTEAAAAKEHELAPDCLGASAGLTAPNSVPGTNYDDICGRRRSGHWVIPPGRNTYQSPSLELLSPKQRTLRLVWSHVHPLLENVTLLQCKGKKTLFQVKSETDTRHGLEIKSIETLSSPEGITLPPNERMELQCTYNNTTGEALDSMVAVGMFYDDDLFTRPDWKSAPVATAAPPAVMAVPLFDKSKDGPLLTRRTRVRIETSKGPLRLVLDPALAPIHATQVYRLLTSGAYRGTPLEGYEPGRYLKFGNATALTSQKELRRLPLESRAPHKRGVLTMARYDEPDSALSSFSILLADQPHMDGSYTVFGYVDSDPASEKTVRALTEDFRPNVLTLIGKGAPVK